MELNITENVMAYEKVNTSNINLSTKISPNCGASNDYDDMDFNVSLHNISSLSMLVPNNMSSNTTVRYYGLIKQPVVMLVVLTVSYSIVFFLALMGNLSVVLVVAKDKSLHTATNFLLVNMAVADMLMAIFCLPITLMYNIFNGEYIMCICSSYFVVVTSAAV
ncbi:unnamed protein product [Candidula unifasciata]|uniref:Neuropeptide Y receptor type 1 n=1 Tax=Candidula unifasciata TaxID=100452 RepID=A0A8S3Z714_9EUPU|nr:unnamed protein product [Candidula unifasciata]